jgi:CRISPR-associated protein Csm2
MFTLKNGTVIDGVNYCEKAEKVMNELYSSEKKITTTQIRNLLTLITQIYNELLMDRSDMGAVLTSEQRSKISYLRVRMVYEAGRTEAVKKFLEKTGLLDIHKEINDSKEKFLLYHKYFESLVAYHRFLGGSDK